MSMRYKGGVISATPPTVSTTSATGVWTLPQQYLYQGAGTWPLSVIPDPYFEYVTMLLHGDGTNGAQNNTFLDSSTNAFTITRNGNTTQGTFSPYGSLWSNYFDGSGDYLSYPSNAAFQFGTGDFTIEFWWNPSTLASTQAILYNTDNASVIGTGHYAVVYNTSLGMRLYINGGATTVTQGATTGWSVGVWYHVAIVRNGNTATIYRDGVSIASASVTGVTIGAATTSYFGGEPLDPLYSTGFFSNFRIVKGTAVYTTAFSPPTSPLTAITNTSLLTCQSNRFIDNSTNAFTITVNGNTGVQRFSPFSPTAAYATSTIGGSGYFDGVGDTLTLSANTALQMDSGDFTVEMWHYCPLATNQLMTLFATSDPNSSGSLCLFNESSSWTVRIGGLGNDLTVAVNASQRNAWVHVALVRNSGTLTLYLNGTSVVTGTRTQNVTQSIVNIGVLGGFGVNYTGYISNFRIVKGTAVYTGNFTPPTAPVTAITNTSLLLNFTNGGIFDNSMMNDLETVGNAQISTSVKKFGTGSLAFDATDDRLVMVGSPNFAFGTGDFTIEFWMNSNDVSGAQRAPCQISTTAGGLSTSYTNGLIIVQGGNATGGSMPGGLYVIVNSVVIGSNTPVLSTGTWYHIALTRQSGTVRLFVDGNLHTSGTSAGDLTGQNLVVGGGYSTAYLLNGYLDDFRITKGYARYTANFTPPTAAFPNL